MIRCFTSHTAKKVGTLYTTMVRSVLEYGAPTWSPYYKKGIDILENVQNRCLRLSKEEVYKYIHGYYKTGSEELFHMAHRQLSGHSRKLFRPSSKSVPRSNFFSQRVIKKWNALPQDIVEASTLSSFKSKLSVLLTEEEGQN